MRTAIFLAGAVISFAIRPDAIFPVGMGFFLAIGLVVFVIMDVVDFFHSKLSF